MAVFWKFGTTIGDVLETQHVGWIKLTSTEWTVSREVRQPQGTGQTRTNSSAQVSEFKLTKQRDVASFDLAQNAFNGTAEAVCYIDWTRTNEGQEDILRHMELSEAIISYHRSEGGADGAPLESYYLNFTNILIREFKTDPKNESITSPVNFTWDLQKAAKK